MLKLRYPQDVVKIYTAHNIHNISLPLLMAILLAPPLGLKATSLDLTWAER